jgi:hypothetical protein
MSAFACKIDPVAGDGLAEFSDTAGGVMASGVAEFPHEKAVASCAATREAGPGIIQQTAIRTRDTMERKWDAMGMSPG